MKPLHFDFDSDSHFHIFMEAVIAFTQARLAIGKPVSMARAFQTVYEITRDPHLAD